MIILCLSAFDEPLATTTETASFLSWFLPLIASHGLLPLPLERLSFVRPARAHSWRCKSSRKLATANEAKRNCGRVTNRGKEAWSVNREPMNKNRIGGAAEQGERARSREALVIKAKWRKSGGCAAKECVLTWGDLALCLKGRRC